MPQKSFSVPKGGEPVEFDLEGKHFRCHERLAAGIIMRFADVMGGKSEEDVDPQAAVKMMREFFESAIIEEDFEEFWNLIEDPKIAIPVETLAEVASWLAEQYTQRPTGAPSSSGRSNVSSGGGSTAPVYSREPIFDPSKQIEPATS